MAGNISLLDMASVSLSLHSSQIKMDLSTLVSSKSSEKREMIRTRIVDKKSPERGGNIDLN